MIVKRAHFITGCINQMEMDVTEEQLYEWMNTRKLIQNVMPNLTPTQREFLITGMTEEEQNKFYGSFKDED